MTTTSLTHSLRKIYSLSQGINREPKETSLGQLINADTVLVVNEKEKGRKDLIEGHCVCEVFFKTPPRFLTFLLGPVFGFYI